MAKSIRSNSSNKKPIKVENKKKNKEKDDKTKLNRDKPLYPEQQLLLTIDVPPSINNAYIRTRKGAKTFTPETKRYIYNVRTICMNEMDDIQWKKDKEHVWYYMDLYFYFPDKKIRDSHNCLKVLMDALEGVLYDNDYYIMPRIMLVELDKENPRLDICYYPAPYIT